MESSKKVSARSFIIGWLALLIAVILLYIGTGEWTIDPSQNYDYALNHGLKLVIDLLLVVALFHAQYPFQSWLIESVVAPTPVSTIMHAGIVNAGHYFNAFFTDI